jgi:hypothetical protein
VLGYLPLIKDKFTNKKRKIPKISLIATEFQTLAYTTFGQSTDLLSMALEVTHELPRKEVSNETWKYEKAEDTSMCRYWIKRKQRSCRHRAADGNLDGFCSDHSKEG